MPRVLSANHEQGQAEAIAEESYHEAETHSRGARAATAPLSSAIAVLQAPAIKPLRQATSIASLVDTLRVRLLSTAQHRQAPTMSSAPGDRVAPPGSQASSTPPKTMATIPSTILPVGVLLEHDPGDDGREDAFDVQKQGR